MSQGNFKKESRWILTPEVWSQSAHDAAKKLLAEGNLHTSNLADPDLEPLAQELVFAGEEKQGLSVYPEAGKLLLFFTMGDHGDVDPMSWHGGARVGSAGAHGGKWMLQIFKTIPPELRNHPDEVTRFLTRCRQPPSFVQGLSHHPQEKIEKPTP